MKGIYTRLDKTNKNMILVPVDRSRQCKIRLFLKFMVCISIYIKSFRFFAQYLCTGFDITYNFVIERTSLSRSFGIKRGSSERTRYNLCGWYCWLYGIQHLLRSVFSVTTINFYLIHSFIQFRSLLSSKRTVEIICEQYAYN